MQSPNPNRPKSRALRRGRFSEPGRIYLLTTTTQDRVPIFEDWHLGRLLVQSMRHCHGRRWAETLAFVVMPDHMHWLVQLGNERTLNQIMRSFKAHTAHRVNDRRGTPGQQVWQPGYHDRAVRSEENIRAIARYIVANPLRAGIVGRVGDYPLWDAVWL